MALYDDTMTPAERLKKFGARAAQQAAPAAEATAEAPFLKEAAAKGGKFAQGLDKMKSLAGEARFPLPGKAAVVRGLGTLVAPVALAAQGAQTVSQGEADRESGYIAHMNESLGAQSPGAAALQAVGVGLADIVDRPLGGLPSRIGQGLSMAASGNWGSKWRDFQTGFSEPTAREAYDAAHPRAPVAAAPAEAPAAAPGALPVGAYNGGLEGVVGQPQGGANGENNPIQVLRRGGQAPEVTDARTLQNYQPLDSEAGFGGRAGNMSAAVNGKDTAASGADGLDVRSLRGLLDTEHAPSATDQLMGGSVFRRNMGKGRAGRNANELLLKGAQAIDIKNGAAERDTSNANSAVAQQLIAADAARTKGDKVTLRDQIELQKYIDGRSDRKEDQKIAADKVSSDKSEADMKALFTTTVTDPKTGQMTSVFDSTGFARLSAAANKLGVNVTDLSPEERVSLRNRMTAATKVDSQVTDGGVGGYGEMGPEALGPTKEVDNSFVDAVQGGAKVNYLMSKLPFTDPDRGKQILQYDANGNVVNQFNKHEFLRPNGTLDERALRDALGQSNAEGKKRGYADGDVVSDGHWARTLKKTMSDVTGGLYQYPPKPEVAAPAPETDQQHQRRTLGGSLRIIDENDKKGYALGDVVDDDPVKNLIQSDNYKALAGGSQGRAGRNDAARMLGEQAALRSTANPLAAQLQTPAPVAPVASPIDTAYAAQKAKSDAWNAQQDQKRATNPWAGTQKKFLDAGETDNPFQVTARYADGDEVVDVAGKLVRGPGTGTSDDIPAIHMGSGMKAALSDNEFVMRDVDVEHHGLRKLRAMMKETDRANKKGK